MAGRRFAIADASPTRRGALEQVLIARGLQRVALNESPELLVWVEQKRRLDSVQVPDETIVVAGTTTRDPDLETRAWSRLPLPIDPVALLAAFGQALEHRALSDENAQLRARLAERQSLGPLVTSDPGMREVVQTAETVADTHATVLILGESGTGKSLLARAIHQSSQRASEPMVTVNCGALPGSLLESELFGHAKGAFTGALADRPGRFEQAGRGTLFLDEINSASPDLQVKLLRVLQERTFERVGESVSRRTEARVIAATNQDLDAAVQAGDFREDLYWRLNVVSLTVPPLRDRPVDLALLLDRFLDEFALEYQRNRLDPSPEALEAMAAYEWPGNVRQLRNAIERAVLLTRGSRLDLGALPKEVSAAVPPLPPPNTTSGLLQGLENLRTLGELPSLKKALAGPEKALLVRALELAGGSRKDAAESLGINRSTLFNKMTKYGLMELTFRPFES